MKMLVPSLLLRSRRRLCVWVASMIVSPSAAMPTCIAVSWPYTGFPWNWNLQRQCSNVLNGNGVGLLATGLSLNLPVKLQTSSNLQTISHPKLAGRDLRVRSDKSPCSRSHLIVARPVAWSTLEWQMVRDGIFQQSIPESTPTICSAQYLHMLNLKHGRSKISRRVRLNCLRERIRKIQVP